MTSLNFTAGLLDSVEYTEVLSASAAKDSDEMAYEGITGSGYLFAMLNQGPALAAYSPSRETFFVTTSRNLSVESDVARMHPTVEL